MHAALKMLRIFNGLSQAALADSLGLSRSYVCEIESGKKKPTLEILNKYSKAFDTPVSSLMLFSEKMESEKFSEKVRVFSAEKILKFMEWISRDIDNDTCTENTKS